MAKMKSSVSKILQEQESQYSSEIDSRSVDVRGYEEWIRLQAQLRGLWFADLDLSYVETDSNFVVVKWNCVLDERSWGIRDLDLSIVDVSINVTLVVVDDNDEEVEFEFLVDSAASDKWDIRIEDGQKTLPLAPTGITIDLKEKKILVSFHLDESESWKR